MIRLMKILTTSFTVVAMLVACGSGQSNTCGAKAEYFYIDFNLSNYSAKIGVPYKIVSTVRPESCRNDASFSVKSGSLPLGMELDNGNIVGTPTTAGIYSFEIYLFAVKNYEDLSYTNRSGSFAGPYSRKVTVVVSQ